MGADAIAKIAHAMAATDIRVFIRRLLKLEQFKTKERRNWTQLGVAFVIS
jgi:hypothetical protein